MLRSPVDNRRLETGGRGRWWAGLEMQRHGRPAARLSAGLRTQGRSRNWKFVSSAGQGPTKGTRLFRVQSLTAPGRWRRPAVTAFNADCFAAGHRERSCLSSGGASQAPSRAIAGALGAGTRLWSQPVAQLTRRTGRSDRQGSQLSAALPPLPPLGFAGRQPEMASSQSNPQVLRQEIYSFRIAELQKVAEKLGLRKTGEQPGRACWCPWRRCMCSPCASLGVWVRPLHCCCGLCALTGTECQHEPRAMLRPCSSTRHACICHESPLLLYPVACTALPKPQPRFARSLNPGRSQARAAEPHPAVFWGARPGLFSGAGPQRLGARPAAAVED